MIRRSDDTVYFELPMRRGGDAKTHCTCIQLRNTVAELRGS